MDLVKIVNTGTDPLILRHDEFGDVTIDAGKSRIVQSAVATVAFGHPAVRNEGNRRFRDDEFQRIRVQWGFYAGLMDEDDWEQMCPQFEAYNLDDERIFFIIDDPDGTRDSAGFVGQDGADERTLQQQISDLEAQLAQVTRALGGSDLEASTPSKPSRKATANVDDSAEDAEDAEDADTQGAQARRNEERDNIPKPPADEPETVADRPRSTRVGSRSSK